MEKLDLHGKTGFIIGGTRGIGNAIAMRMAGLGMNLTVIARQGRRTRSHEGTG